MKILVVCQYYAPEPVRISDICEELVRRGHEVDVITGVPNYPMGKIYDGYRGGEKRDEVIGGVHVHRSFTVGRRNGALFRFLNYYSFALSSSIYAAMLEKKYDVVLVNQLSPVMMACAGVEYKKKYSVPLVYYCLDLWPESLVAGGVKRGSLTYKMFDKISGKLYSRADKILVTSKNFRTYFEKQFGISRNKLSYLPQYAEDLFKPTPPESKETVDLTFAGNIGAAQSVETIIRAAAELSDVKGLRFNIVGDGSALAACRQLAAELGVGNVVFHGRKPLEAMPRFYREADAMLVTLSDDPLISMTLPGKVQTYMAAGKPLIGAINGETPEIIADAGCGLCGPAEDHHALAENIRAFLCADKEQLGRNSAEYYQKHFRKDAFVDTLIAELSMHKTGCKPARKQPANCPKRRVKA